MSYKWETLIFNPGIVQLGPWMLMTWAQRCVCREKLSCWGRQEELGLFPASGRCICNSSGTLLLKALALLLRCLSPPGWASGALERPGLGGGQDALCPMPPAQAHLGTVEWRNVLRPCSRDSERGAKPTSVGAVALASRPPWHHIFHNHVSGQSPSIRANSGSPFA